VPRTPTWNVALKWIAEEGSQVKTGDPVAQLDNSAIASSLEDRRQALVEAELQLEKTRADLEIQRLQKSQAVLEKRIDRDKAKLDAQVPGEIRSTREYQEKQLALEKAEGALSQADRDLHAFGVEEQTQLGVLGLQRDKARRQVRQAEGSLEALTLRAPQSGILIHGIHGWESRRWRVGDILQPGQTVVELPDLSQMYVEARMSDLDDSEILPGMPARCRLEALPERVFPGRLEFINAAAEELSDASGTLRFFRVRVSLDQSDPQVMRPGMSVKVEVIRRRLEDRWLVARALLDLEATPPTIRRDDGSRVPIELEACGAVECALKGDPAPMAMRVATP
jgi:HlyD family secretion protein